MKKISLLLGIALWLPSGCDGLTPAKLELEECHFVEADIYLARPDGYPCSPARCSEDGTSYIQRGSCFDLGSRCEIPTDLVLCAPDEICFETPVTGNATQALCIQK